jgi:hypothetical protein
MSAYEMNHPLVDLSARAWLHLLHWVLSVSAMISQLQAVQMNKQTFSQ